MDVLKKKLQELSNEIFELQEKLTDGEFKAIMDLSMDCFKLTETIKVAPECKCNSTNYLCKNVTEFVTCQNKEALLTQLPILAVYFNIYNQRLFDIPESSITYLTEPSSQAVNAQTIETFMVRFKKQLMFIVSLLNTTSRGSKTKLVLSLCIIEMIYKNFSNISSSRSPRSSSIILGDKFFETLCDSLLVLVSSSNLVQNWNEIKIFFVDKAFPTSHIQKFINTLLDHFPCKKQHVVAIREPSVQSQSRRLLRPPQQAQQVERPLQSSQSELQLQPQPQPQPHEEEEQEVSEIRRENPVRGGCRFIYKTTCGSHRKGSFCDQRGVFLQNGYCNSHKKYKNRFRTDDGILGTGYEMP